MRIRMLDRPWRKTALIFTAVLAFSTLGIGQAYQQTNFISDFQCNTPTATEPCLAPTPDSNLVNPWGLIASGKSPWWVSDNNGGVSTLYNGNTGAIVPLVVNIPPIVMDSKANKPRGTGTPTGVAFTGASGFTFHAKNTQGQDTMTGAVFTFVTEDGTIVAWGPGINPTDLPNDAFVVVDNSKNPSTNKGAVYKGATIAPMKAGGPFFLYVTNFRSGRIEVYDTKFKRVDLDDADNDHDDQAFTDSKIPSGFAPFNVQEVNGNLYVTYAKQNASKHDDFDFPGLGFVDKFSPTGTLLQRLEQGPWLNAPWGVAIAPANFGFFSNHLLIGNAGSGQIAVYDAKSGRFDGLLRDTNGHGLQNDRLWALRFGNGQAAGPSNWLFFTAGISGEAHGLFGFFTSADKSASENGNDE
jgi:uncharacterized protein (TIGR03118 family)